MAQYINKDALLAEINKREGLLDLDNPLGRGGMVELECLKDTINTLEVKEVDLDEAARKWEDKVYLEKGWQDEYGTPHAPFSEIGNAFREGVKFILKVQKGE